jgi:hypothetical protein
MSSALLRIYAPEECTEPGRQRGYPFAWDRCPGCGGEGAFCELCDGAGSIKGLIRQLADRRCIRCLHPYRKGTGEWSPCDERCVHNGPVELRADVLVARWRILTVHHLNEVKADCRWWNLAALCQRCHLNIQTRVKLDQPWPFEHSEWFKPYAAGFYASSILGEELDRFQTLERLEELLALEHRQTQLEGIA